MAAKLEDVRGIGPAAAELLREHGFTTVDALATSKPMSLAAVKTFGLIRAKQVIAVAKELVAGEAPVEVPAKEKKLAAKKTKAAKDKTKPKKSEKSKKDKDKKTKDKKGKKGGSKKSNKKKDVPKKKADKKSDKKTEKKKDKKGGKKKKK